MRDEYKEVLYDGGDYRLEHQVEDYVLFSQKHGITEFRIPFTKARKNDHIAGEVYSLFCDGKHVASINTWVDSGLRKTLDGLEEL